MKKIIVLFAFLFTCGYTFSVNASDITLESTQTFYPSQWIVESLPIKINISNYNDTTNNKYFTLMLPEDSNIRFSEDFSSLKISWSWSLKVWTWVTIMSNLRELRFNLSESLINGDSFDISWLKIKVYSKPQWDKYIWIDLNWDKVTDAVSLNWYRVNDINAYSDTMAPSEVFNFTWSIVDNKVIVSAEMPGDVDFQAVVLENLNSSWTGLSSFFRYDLNNFTYDLQTWYDSIRIKTVDIRANYSTWVVYTLNSLKNTPQVVENTWSVVIEEPILVTPVVVIDTVEKYNPVFKNQVRLLNKVVKFVDDYISKKLIWKPKISENSLMITRNKIIIELVNLDLATNEQKPEIVKNIRAYFKELALQLK